MKLSKEQLKEVSFPVGGIGAGCIGISGEGRLIDWEIFNRAGKGRTNGFSHFSVRAEKEGNVVASKILTKDLTGQMLGDIMWKGFGWGPTQSTFCSYPHFKECSLDGAFPAAEYTFRDPGFPAEVKLTAWSPFIPGRSDLASMPCAVFEMTLTNCSHETYNFTGIGMLTNPWQGESSRNTFRRNGTLSELLLGNGRPKDDLEYGELAISTDAPDVSYQEYLYRGKWRDAMEVYWHDLGQPGKFQNRNYPSQGSVQDSGFLAAHFTLNPGECKTVRFLISWFIPNRRNDWTAPEQLQREMENSGITENRWKNYYAMLCGSALEAAEKIFSDYDNIRNGVFSFRNALHDSTIPAAALEGAAENLAVLISPTCLRLQDGTFWGWEGVGTVRGSCPGSCQHVWNYAQALPLLFPDLERSMREAQAKYNLDPRGGSHFRMQLPLGIKAQNDWHRPCVDGSFGEVMKTFREWKISGDTDWLRSMWPSVRAIMEFCWSAENPDRWDPEKSGMISGRQHHTLDMELFGPSGWLEGHYLGALKAASEMGRACGDTTFADECLAIFEKGKARTANELFNGKFFIQKVDLSDRKAIEPVLNLEDTEGWTLYWDSEHHQLKYQIGEGCEIDSHLGAWYAKLYGIGELFDPAQLHSELKSLFEYNFKPSVREFCNPWRSFAINDEGALLICTWPDAAKKPLIPLPYNSEAMTGFEWAAACNMVMNGLTEEGLTIAKAIRERYDGAKRNPWNEIECGSNYARSMASYAMLQAYSGFRYDMTRGMIGFAPILPGKFRTFWSLGTIWGTFETDGEESRLTILHGEAKFKAFQIHANRVSLNGNKLNSQQEIPEELTLKEAIEVKHGDVLSFSSFMF